MEDRRRYLPGATTPAGWSFLADSPFASVPVPAGFVVEIAIGPTGFRIADKLTPPAAVAKLIGWAKGVSRQPLVIIARGTIPGGTAADLLFGGLADSLGCAVLVADGPVWVTGHGILRTAGVFRQWHPRGPGRLQPVVASRHRVLGATLPPRVIAHPQPPMALTANPLAPSTPAGTAPATRTAPAPGWAPTLAPAPAPALAPPVPATAQFAPLPASPPVATALPKADLALLDAGRWTGQWTALPTSSPVRPTAPPPLAPQRAAAAASVSRPVLAGFVPPRTVDAPARTAPATSTPARTTPAWSVPASTTPAWSTPASTPVRDTVAPRAEVEPVATNAIWIASDDWNTDDRAKLRRSLNGRYDMYARIVARTLAEEPGLRGAGASAEVLADLVALCAYHAGERDVVNLTLRTGNSQPSDGRGTLVARGAAQGLRRLPVVLGPVFVAGRDASPVIDRYFAGEELIEPAFVDVDLARGPADDATVEFIIWSVSARRLDRISRDNSTTAVFPPGTRFAVLAVDPPEDGGPMRVLLRDRAGERPGDDSGSEQLLDRLRRAVPGKLIARPQRLLTFAPGLDGHGRRFVAPETPTPEQPRRIGRGGARM